MVVEITRPAILVVDDDAAIRDFLQEGLREEGYTVHTAADGFQALVAIEEQAAALLLLDMRMPHMDARTLVHHLRARGVQVPVILMSATPGVEKIAAELGVASCLVKPFDWDELLGCIHKVLGA